jgi:hypothetical protein
LLGRRGVNQSSHCRGGERLGVSRDVVL